jgi:hypothetical protein
MRLRIAIGLALGLFTVVVTAALPANAVAQGSVELLTTGPTAGHPSYEPQVSFVSADARHVFFDTRERLTADDQDGNCPDPFADDPETAPKIDCLDVYERSGGQTRLVSFGANGPFDAALIAISSDGSKAFFGTGEPLLPEDTDTTGDIYESSNGSLALVTIGTTTTSVFDGASEDGSKVFFGSAEQLSPEDHNVCADIYAYSGGALSMVSTGPTDPANPPYRCTSLAIGDGDTTRAISVPDGAHFFFYSDRPLVAADRDDYDRDIYEWTGGEVRMVSTGPTSDTVGIGGPSSANFQTASPDGSHVFFSTNDHLVAEDTGTDVSFDNYERDSSGIHLFAPAEVRSDPTLYATPLATSTDGTRVYLWSNARLDPSDTDSFGDIYLRLNGSYFLVSTGPFNGPAGEFGGVDPSRFLISRDGTRAFFQTVQQLVPEDTDSAYDVYERVGGQTLLLTPGTPNAIFNSWWYATPDGSRFFFQTLDPLVPEDTDTRFDVYEWVDGSVRLIDPGVPTSDDIRLGLTAGSRAASDDGDRLLLYTAQPLVPEDSDTLVDLYAFSDNNRLPDCSGVSASRSLLWPANGGLRIVELAGATDPDGDSVTLSITGVTQDEPLTRRYDAALTSDPAVVRIRAQRDGKGDGRVYLISFTASDGSASCAGTAKVSVPRHRGKAAVDSAPPSYDSLGGQ